MNGILRLAPLIHVLVNYWFRGSHDFPISFPNRDYSISWNPDIVIQDVQCSIHLPNAKWDSGAWHPPSIRHNANSSCYWTSHCYRIWSFYRIPIYLLLLQRVWHPYSSGHLVLSHLGLAYTLLLRLIFPRIAVFSGLRISILSLGTSILPPTPPLPLDDPSEKVSSTSQKTEYKTCNSML